MRTDNKATDYFKRTIQAYLEQRTEDDALFAPVFAKENKNIRKLGEFPTIKEARQFAHDSKLSGVFNLIGDNYRDSWYATKYI